MKLLYIIPYRIIYLMCKCLQLMWGVPEPTSMWQTYFSDGYDFIKVRKFMITIKEKDSQSYWMLIITPIIPIALLTIMIIFQVG